MDDDDWLERFYNNVDRLDEGIYRTFINPGDEIPSENNLRILAMRCMYLTGIYMKHYFELMDEIIADAKRLIHEFHELLIDQGDDIMETFTGVRRGFLLFLQGFINRCDSIMHMETVDPETQPIMDYTKGLDPYNFYNELLVEMREEKEGYDRTEQNRQRIKASNARYGRGYQLCVQCNKIKLPPTNPR
jgi:hypothetical protein